MTRCTPPRAFFVRVANKGVIIDEARKSGRKKSWLRVIDPSLALM
jgi:hypothetical protein